MEALHKRFDEKGEDAARKLGEELKLNPATIKIQLRKFGLKPSKAKPKVTPRAPNKKANGIAELGMA